MKRVLVPLLLVFALLAIAFTGYWLKRPAPAQAVVCAEPLAGCTFIHRGSAVKLVFSTPPKPLESFDLRIHAPGVTRISAAFQMNGMDMGFNRYDLRSTGSGTFIAKVTLPVCVSGRHDWTLHLEVDGRHYALPFSTE
jgi:hypothetical protein